MATVSELRRDSSATFTFREVEQIFQEELPTVLKVAAAQNPELARAKREFIYHFLSAQLADEGILDDDLESASDLRVVAKTLKQWHGLWAEGFRN